MTDLVIVECKVAQVLACLRVKDSSSESSRDRPKIVGVVYVGSDLQLGWVLLLGEQVYDLSSKVSPLLCVGENVVSGVGPPESGIVVVVDLKRRFTISLLAAVSPRITRLTSLPISIRLRLTFDRFCLREP